MKKKGKKLLTGKKRIIMFTLGAVCISALAVGIFFVQKGQTKQKRQTKQEKTAEAGLAGANIKITDKAAKEKEKNGKEDGNLRREKKGPWTDYDAFIADVRACIKDGFSNTSAEGVDISPAFEDREINDKWHILGYYLEDLDSDGVKELFFGSREKGFGYTEIYDIYAMKGGFVTHVAEGDKDNYYSLCKNGQIENYNSASFTEEQYRAYYTWKDGELQFSEALITKGEKLFFSREGITAENAVKVDWKQISEELQETGRVKKDIVFTPFIEIPDSSVFSDNENLTYKDLAEKVFWFYSGAGGWNTDLIIREDGTFTGIYEDADADELRRCDFSGRFTNLTKTGPYEYTMKLEDLKLEQKPGTTGGIIHGRKVCYSEPYGFDDAEEFKIYLPGKKVNELPEGFLSWAHNGEEDWQPCYGIYNVGGGQGFVEMEDMEPDYREQGP